MRILWLAPYLPVPTFGGGTRTFNLMKAMARTCEIDLLAGGETPPDQVPAELRSLCRVIQLFPRPNSSQRRKRMMQIKSLLSTRSAQHLMLYSREMQQAITRSVHEISYDAVIVEHSFMGCYTIPDEQVVVLDQHNVESEIFRRAAQHERSLVRRMYNSIEYRKYRAEEQRICRRASLLLATSDLDRETMQGWPDMPNCIVIPNGVDSDFFAPEALTVGDEPRTDVLFFGSMHYAPNTAAMLFFAEKIWPRIRQNIPPASLAIVGMNPPPEIQALEDRPGISVIGFVPDIRPYLAGAKVIVAPLRIGGGTRLKILEAMALGAAVVSTSVGCEGLDVQNGQHLLVADEPGEFADSVISLLRDPERRQALGHAARCLVTQLYDWKALELQLQAALTEVLGRNQSGKERHRHETVTSGIG